MCLTFPCFCSLFVVRNLFENIALPKTYICIQTFDMFVQHEQRNQLIDRVSYSVHSITLFVDTYMCVVAPSLICTLVSCEQYMYNIFQTKCFSDSREKRDASLEKRDSSREKRDTS